MRDAYFTCQANDNEWHETHDEAARLSIRETPLILVLEYFHQRTGEKWQKAWCEKHQAYEDIASQEGTHLVTTSGCQLTGLIAKGETNIYQKAHSFEMQRIHITVRWQVLHHETENKVYLIFDNVDVHYTWRKVPSGSYLLVPCVFLRSSYCHTFQINAQEQPDCAFYAPKPVIQKMIKALYEDAIRIYGPNIRLLPPPTNSFKAKNADTETWLLALLHRPLDMNIYFLHKYFEDDKKFNKLFPREQRQNFNKLAETLHLPPTDELRKAYEENPLSLVFCLMLPELGIKNKQLIKRFFPLYAFCGYMITEDYHKNFFFNPLQTCTECSTASKPPTEYYNSDEAIADYNSLRFYCQWRRKHESEDDLANLLLDRQKNWHDWKFTALQAFQKHFNRLPQELLNEVLQDGISAKIHDKLMILQHTCQEADAPCGEQELARECSINDYNFRLISSITKYRAITRYNMIPRRSYRNLTDKAIYAIERNGRYLGVFKVKGNIVEEESPQDYDDIITRTKCHIAYLTWVNHHNLERNNYWPEDCETALKQEFSIEPIKNNEFDNLRLEEMLNLPNKDLRPGFFLSLYRKFAEVTLLYPPSPSPSDNEQEYLLKNFPWGRQIYQAAFAGNPEAQYVMSLIYQDNYCIESNYRLAEQWYKRARANGWLEIAPAKKDVRIDFMIKN